MEDKDYIGLVYDWLIENDSTQLSKKDFRSQIVDNTFATDIYDHINNLNTSQYYYDITLILSAAGDFFEVFTFTNDIFYWKTNTK